jgi:threonine aldolase
MMKTTIKKLSAMPYAQAHVEIHEDGAVSLFSYVTLVAHITADGWLTVYGLYSMTTRKHISAFMREYAHPCDYQTAKVICNNCAMINIHTGEIVDLE